MQNSSDAIPVCVLITTKNEERNIARCLDSAASFSYVAVIDSHSSDRTTAIAREKGAHIMSYKWDGKYPKKRQWCLDTLALPYDWVLWLDADEELTEAFVAKVRALFQKGEPKEYGFFVRGQYVWNGRELKYGMRNNKIALMNRRKMVFPVVDDLDIAGMGEIEGHYQPVLRNGSLGRVGQIRAPILHHAYEDKAKWDERHDRYARWEAEMIRGDRYPPDPMLWRQMIKSTLRGSAVRPYLAFIYYYIVRGGVFDGMDGLSFALSRMGYLRLVRRHLVSY